MASHKGSSKHKQEKYKAQFAITEKNKARKKEKEQKRIEKLKTRNKSS